MSSPFPDVMSTLLRANHGLCIGTWTRSSAVADVSGTQRMVATFPLLTIEKRVIGHVFHPGFVFVPGCFRSADMLLATVLLASLSETHPTPYRFRHPLVCFHLRFHQPHSFSREPLRHHHHPIWVPDNVIPRMNCDTLMRTLRRDGDIECNHLDRLMRCSRSNPRSEDLWVSLVRLSRTHREVRLAMLSQITYSTIHHCADSPACLGSCRHQAPVYCVQHIVRA